MKIFKINNTTLEMNSLSQVSSKEKKMKLRNSYGLYRFNTLVQHITYATMIIDNYQWYTQASQALVVYFFLIPLSTLDWLKSQT